MRIVEKDFKIEYDGVQYTLFFLKSKKELKEDAGETFKTIGYYTEIYNALRVVYFWRRNDKYPFKESTDAYKKAIIAYKKANDNLKKTSEKIYDVIFEFKKKTFDGIR